MKIWRFSLFLKKEPSPGVRLNIVEESLGVLRQSIVDLSDNLGVVSRQVEATRKKVYRDEIKGNGVEAPVVPGDEVTRVKVTQPGDLPPPDWV